MLKTNVKLLNFFIFNPLLGLNEGEEHKKLLYYYPEDSSLNTKIKHIGLAEAIIRFCSTFTNTTCENLHTLKTRQLYYEGEKNYWFVMTVSIPCIERNTKGDVEYLDDNVNDLVYRSIIICAYRIFKLLNGSIEHIIKTMEIEGLKLRFAHFFNQHLPIVNLSDSDINSVFQGLQFLPLDRTSYVKIQSFVNHLEEAIPQISHTIVICNKQLVWSGIEQEDCRVMYNYLINHLLNNSNTITSSIQTLNFKQSKIGCFLYGPSDFQEDSNMGTIPLIFLSNFKDQGFHLALYYVLDCAICILIDGSFHLHFDFFRKLNSFLSMNFDPLALTLKEIINKRQILNYLDSSYKYIYFNHLNLAQKSTINSHNDNPLSNALLKLCSSLYQDMKWTDSRIDEEMLVKFGDCWLCMKKSDDRDVLVFINNRHANLTEVDDELRKICSNQFNKIFYPESLEIVK